MPERWDYRKAGVDIDRASAVIGWLKDKALSTLRPEVVEGIGGFAGVFRISDRYTRPCLVAGSDGVGTKLKVALALNRHDTVGKDLVAMCVNDVLAGFAVGIEEEEAIVTGRDIAEGDVLIGLASSGLHSNGFSLVRKVLQHAGIPFDAEVEGRSLAEELLRPTRIYVRSVLPLLREVRVKGMAHITGGGIVENLPRILPESLRARVRTDTIPVPWVFRFIQKKGDIPEEEMWRVFNMGVGFVLVVARDEAERTLHLLQSAKERAWILGEIVRGERGVTLE
jgi:phosphoribosylformylglycinamidine cyclo-ligase